MNQELLNGWISRAKENVQKIAFPEATEEKILLAAREAMNLGAIESVLVGDVDAIKEAAAAANVDISDMLLVSNTDADAVLAYGERYLAMHPDSPLSAKSLARKSKDSMYLAMIMEELGEIDGVFAGLSHTTGDVILAATTIFGMAEGVSTVSSIGIADIPGYEGENGSLLPFGDAAVNVDPNESELADIAISSCETIRDLLGWEPKCAMLSFSTDGSTEHEQSLKVRNAVKLANERRPDLAIDGEFQLDSAISPEVAAKKVRRESRVAGHANILIYPNLSAGNIGVKIFQQFAKADAYGPILQGIARPISDCSRGAPVSELLGNIIMLAVRAQAAK